jgi:hypothetical protein
MKETHMKHIITSLALTSTFMLIGCNKTENAKTMASAEPEHLDVDVQVEGGEIIVMIDGEEQVLDLEEVMSGVGFENIDGEVSVSVMAFSDNDGKMPHPSHMMQMQRGGAPHGEWRMHDHDIPEEHQFMDELGILNEIAMQLHNNDAVALLGIHMIRDELEGDVRMGALEAIIEESASGTPARNAAIIVAIQTMQEEGDEEAAADLMVELVLSN